MPFGGGGGGGGGRVLTKQGTNAGDYTSTTGSFVAVDATNLDVTVVVPLGSIAVALLMATGKSGSSTTLSLGIAVDGTIAAACCQITGGISGNGIPCSAQAVLVGDGASHVFEPQWKASGASPIILLNSGNSVPPLHIVMLLRATT